MPIKAKCRACGMIFMAQDSMAGSSCPCPGCNTTIRFPATIKPSIDRHPEPSNEVRAASVVSVNDKPEASTKSYRRMRRELLIIMIRQRFRRLCDFVRLGPSTGERAACSLIIGFIPFAVSFGASIAMTQEPMYAALQGIGSFLIVAAFCSSLVLWGRDEELEIRRVELARELPMIKGELDRIQRQKETHRPEFARCPFCREKILPGAVKCKHCGEILDRQLAESRSRVPKSPGVAAVLEVAFGLFQVFGVGHMYTGNVLFGLLVMVGYWAFVAVNVLCILTSCGILTPFVAVVWPAGWFLTILLSPLVAAWLASD